MSKFAAAFKTDNSNLLLKNYKANIISFLAIPLGLVAIMAFMPLPEGASAERALTFKSAKDSTAFVEATTPEPAACMFDTVNVFGKYWHNTNLFTYSYPSQAPMPDSVYFVMCDSETQFCIPRNGGINSPYGPRWGKMHKGLDIHLSLGDAVKAAMPGKVRYAQFNTGGYGNLVVLRHANGLETYYAHLTELKVKPNEWVEAGTIIGTGGNTGAEWSGVHLHFEMRYHDRAFDPLLAIDWAKKELKSDTLVIYKKHLHATEAPSVAVNDQNTMTLTRESYTDQAKSTYTQSAYSQSTSSSPSHHMVRSGDTVYSIARKYGKSPTKLLVLNGMTTESVLSVGQRVRLK